MKSLNEVIFFSYGDSTNASTWSNVPYLFTKNLELRGTLVRRINLQRLLTIRKILDHSLLKIIKLIFPKLSGFSFGRSKFWYLLEERIIRKSVNRYPNANLCIFMCYDHYNHFNDVPSLCFSDWTYRILIEEKLKREPYFFEQRIYKNQEDVINNAHFVVCLFSNYAELMKLHYPKANVNFLGGNVINSFFEGILLRDDVIKKKQRNQILFIGKKYYKEGLMLLVSSLDCIKKVIPNIELHVIGMTQEQMGVKSECISYHGYLRKDNDIEREEYYNLLQSAGIVVNITPNWGGYSSVIEAMYFYTPILVTPFSSFVNEFGKDIQFGQYADNTVPDYISSKIVEILQSPRYECMCDTAHNMVKNYTWSSYLDRMETMIYKN